MSRCSGVRSERAILILPSEVSISTVVRLLLPGSADWQKEKAMVRTVKNRSKRFMIEWLLVWDLRLP